MHKGNLSEGQLLDHVNRGLRVLQFAHADRWGGMDESSSGRVLQQEFPQLSESQVKAVNQALRDLGLRRSWKEGKGHTHQIRTDVRSVTLDQLRARKPIPPQSGEPPIATADTAAAVDLALAQLREDASDVPDRDVAELPVDRLNEVYKQIEAVGDAGVVIQVLRDLAVYRVYVEAGTRRCFVDVSVGAVTIDMLKRREPLVEWPVTLGELLPKPPPAEAPRTDAERVVLLLKLGHKLEAELEVIRTQLGLSEKRTDELLAICRKQEAVREDVDRRNQALIEANERLERERDTAVGELADLKSRSHAASSPVAAAADEFIERYKAGGGT